MQECEVAVPFVLGFFFVLLFFFNSQHFLRNADDVPGPSPAAVLFLLR